VVAYLGSSGIFEGGEVRQYYAVPIIYIVQKPLESLVVKVRSHKEGKKEASITR
jgi:hypothetical protein